MCRAFLWRLAAATLISGACARDGGGQAPTATAALSPPAPASPVPPVLPGSSANPDPQPATEAALQDAAAHLGVGSAALRVDQVEPREWGDSSLGCPRPGQLYSQIVTPGFLILISGAGKQLEYHSDARARVVL